jgi:hypothetical protein
MNEIFKSYVDIVSVSWYNLFGFDKAIASFWKFIVQMSPTNNLDDVFHLDLRRSGPIPIVAERYVS